MSKLKSVGLYGVTQAVQMAAPLILTPIYTRFIEPDEFGAQSMVSIVYIYGIVFANWGLTAAYERFFFKMEGSQRDRLLASIVGFVGLILLTMTFASWLLGDWVLQFMMDDSHWYPMLPVLFLTGTMSDINSYFMADLKYRQEAGRYAGIDLGRFVLMQVIALPLVVFFRWGIWGQIVGASVCQAATLILFICRRNGRPLLLLDFAILRQCLTFSWPLQVKVFFSAFARTIDYYLIGSAVSLTSLGLYTKAQSWAMISFMYMTTIENVYQPLWNQKLYKDPEGPSDTLGAIFSEFTIIGVWPAVVLILFAKEVVTVLAPPSYYGAIPLTVILSAYMAVSTFGKLYGSVNNWLKLLKYSSTFSSLAQVAIIIGNVLLIPKIGALGAVMSYAVCHSIYLLIMMYIVRRRETLGLEIGFLTRLYLAIGIAIAVSLFDYYTDLPRTVGLPIRLLIGVVIVTIMIRKLGVARIRFVIERAFNAIQKKQAT